MSNKELQEEELEVLQSIYDGDENFKEVSNTTFQYKITTDEDNSKSFLLEIAWGENYPSEIPLINLNAFYNKHLIPEVKDLIISRLNEEATNLLDTAMTYTLFEFAKENAANLTESQPNITVPVVNGVEEERLRAKSPESCTAIKREKKPKLTKQQKRKLASRVNVDGEYPRGWNWVDVVKHLGQTGSNPPASSSSASNS